MGFAAGPRPSPKSSQGGLPEQPARAGEMARAYRDASCDIYDVLVGAKTQYGMTDDEYRWFRLELAVSVLQDEAATLRRDAGQGLHR